jgi:hypothetical protein
MATKPDFWNAWTEPESVASIENPPKYPLNSAWSTESGHSIQMDDTPNRERVRIEHRTGTFIEMHPDGSEVHKVYGDGYEITVKDKYVKVEGSCNIEIVGDVNIKVSGDKTELVEGNYNLHVKGNYKVLSEDIAVIASTNDMEIRAGATALGTLTLSSGDVISLRGDLNVDGEMTASKITSSGRIDALVGMSAGPSGFVSVLGGLSIGIPVAIPTQINCIGMINAGISVNAVGAVNAPLGNFGLMDAVMMTDVVNTTLHNSHIHISPKGPTGPPIPGMI